MVVNSLRPSDAIWRHRSGSTLAQVMACCLTAPSHYLNQCWLIISKVLRHSSEGNFVRDTPATIHKNWLENYQPKFKSPRGQWVELMVIFISVPNEATRHHVRNKLTHWLQGDVVITLTHWPLGDLDAILKLQFSISFYWFVSSHHLRIIPWDECQGTSPMISQTLVEVMAWCRQATSHYLSQCWPSYHMASPDHNELKV